MSIQVRELKVWEKLMRTAEVFSRPEKHLRHIIRDKERFKHFSVKGGGIFFDFSRQRLDSSVMPLLFSLAEERNIKARFAAMMKGEKVNNTEKRAALHTASRSFSDKSLYLDGEDVLPEIKRIRQKIRLFSEKVRQGEIRGCSGKRFRHLVVIGIGGSYLGTQFVSRALDAYADREMQIHFLANVDIHNFACVASRIDPESTLWIIISKSYTTAETLANTRQAYALMEQKGIDPAGHVITVTAKGSPGDDPANPVLASFHMFDFIGGRYSVTSAVGGVPLSLYLGYENFERFLRGAEEMDLHTLQAPAGENLPMIAALIGIWNNNFLAYPAQGIIPYAEPLADLAAHVQQLYMESNGKSLTAQGEPVGVPTGTIIFGEPGTNAQHSFFQLAHQGRPFPIDFIGVIRPQYAQYGAQSKGVTNHQELWANLISQPEALAVGKEDAENPARSFSGNRPSSTILLEDLSPENVGRLLAFYEHRTVFEAFVWGINPFDQFGVELGKILAAGIREEMNARNRDTSRSFEDTDPISRFYLDSLFSGKITDYKE
ncbi:MAG: glucose-6-phosphate isomerase [Desulfococcaceae bacterium]|jgi:glucose-6-phosphate isomerase|nr:glucose-6-phosphate isomerase [Desulfococcaceae bacterium]